jgi:hypothetical protein
MMMMMMMMMILLHHIVTPVAVVSMRCSVLDWS